MYSLLLKLNETLVDNLNEELLPEITALIAGTFSSLLEMEFYDQVDTENVLLHTILFIRSSSYISNPRIEKLVHSIEMKITCNVLNRIHIAEKNAEHDEIYSESYRGMFKERGVANGSRAR